MNQDTLPFLPTTQEHQQKVSDNTPAFFDDHADMWMDYGTLREKINVKASFFPKTQRSLVLCPMTQTIDCVIDYLSALYAGHALLLVPSDLPNLDRIIDRYQPDMILDKKGKIKDCKKNTKPIHKDLCLILLTSGSTGSSKSVRLSYKNIAHNTKAICKSLGLNDKQSALAHLPLSYSFGLSILHTQLAVGGRTILSQESMMSSTLWSLARTQKATLFPGVPYHYEMLMRLGLQRLNCPTLRTFLQAGGKMPKALTKQMLQKIQKIDKGELHIMYGQTEASPRISSLPLHRMPEKIGSAGLPLEDGTFSIKEAELIYQGPNVMMGYAQERADLAQGDEMKGTLRTGDLASLDENGFLTITGRKDRFAKLFGQRIALDHIEKIASEISFSVAIETSDKIIIATQNQNTEKLKQHLTKHTKLPAGWIKIHVVKSFPQKENGKINYAALRKMTGGK